MSSFNFNRLCEDCGRRILEGNRGGRVPLDWACTVPRKTPSILTGKYTETIMCGGERYNFAEGGCGPEGAFWVPKRTWVLKFFNFFRTGEWV